ncbi:MAG: class I adenylate-forming enzyme family protein [Acidimicrobiia bacterium]
MHRDASDVAAYKRSGDWGETTVGDAVAGWARAKPDADAFVTVGADGAVTRTSWAEYDERADRLAHILAGARLSRSDRIAIVMPDGAGVHVAFVAAERAGLTVVGIGHRAGDAELRHLLGLTQARALLTVADHRGRPASELVAELRAEGLPLAHHFVVDADAAGDVVLDGEVVEPRDVDLGRRRYGPDDVFLLNSTSGTTGLPKCVVHTQNRWMYFHRLAVDAGEMHADDVFMSALPAPYGFGIWTQHVTPAVLGAPTVVHERFDADAVLESLERERVSVLACVSTQFLMMLKSPGIDERDLSALRCMFTGGEAVPQERAARFEDVTGARVLQFYGSNETGALSYTSMRDDREHRLDSAGRVIPGMHVRLLDDDGAEITEAGVPGNPVCRGPATCEGYLDDEGANAELFTADGWMRIGDVCTVDADGYLRVVGRTSDIIIRGGKNISAPAVEAAVAGHPAIALAAAVAMPDEVFGERVCLYAELQPGASLTLDDVVTYLRAEGVSPEWFPERLEVLDELPRASGGKVAKGELRADIRRRLAPS